MKLTAFEVVYFFQRKKCQGCLIFSKYDPLEMIRISIGFTEYYTVIIIGLNILYSGAYLIEMQFLLF